MTAALSGYVVECLAKTTCGNVYEVTRGDETVPAKPRRCSMPECRARVRATPVYRVKEGT